MPKENQLSDDVDTTGELDIDNDTADFASGEDQGFDTLEDAIGALDDDEGLTEEQTDLEDGDLTSEDGEPPHILEGGGRGLSRACYPNHCQGDSQSAVVRTSSLVAR